MALYVKITNNQVAECIDTTPPSPIGTDGWMEAVEVRPAITANRQGYTAHTFDLTKNPVEIVYGTFDIAVADRINQMVGNQHFAVQQAINEQGRNPLEFDPAAISTAQATAAANIAKIQACTTHDELDAI